MSEPIQLVPTKSDADIAEELKQDIAKAYEPVLALLDKAASFGFAIHVQTAQNVFKKNQIVQMVVAKHF